jgi:hypothetical protein
METNISPITSESSDQEISKYLKEIAGQKKDLGKIEQVASSPLKICFGILESLCREVLRLRKESDALKFGAVLPRD